MDHVINSMRQWLRVYEDVEEEYRDFEAINHIKKAIKELGKYYK
ncbi:MAG: hypothetical protein ACQEWV_06685 [Bacillota bacterium]